MDNVHGSQHSLVSMNTIQYAATAKMSSFWLFTFLIIGYFANFQHSSTSLNKGTVQTKVNKLNLKNCIFSIN